MTVHSSMCGSSCSSSSSNAIPTRNTPTASSRISTTINLSSDSSADVNKNRNANSFVRQGWTAASTLLSKFNVKGRRKEKEIIEEKTTVNPIVIQPSLNMIPKSLSPYYQPLPRPVQVINLLLGSWLAALSTWKQIPRLHPFSIILWLRTALRHTVAGGASSYLLILRQVSLFLLKSITLTLVAQCCLQEIYKKPSRISMNNLLRRYYLPSTLSRYSKITIPTENLTTSAGNELATKHQTSLGVHYLQYDNNNATTATNSKNDNDYTTMLISNRTTACFDAIYFQHGFGASSLSWLPLFAPLAHKLGARTALGHDAVGFGFTDRPKDTRWYTSKQSASIAQQILLQNIAAAAVAADTDANNGNNGNEANAPPVALVGHSMGSLSILRLATQLPRNMPKLIILSSPALGLLRRKKPSTSDKTSPQSWMGRRRREVGFAIQHKITLPITRYILRRAVGTKNSWRTGLSLAYGNKNTVTDSDVLRYAWPSIGYGWEDGLLNFAAAQQMPQEDELDDDVKLMRRVLELPNTKVVIILGSKDKVVPSKLVYKFVENVKATTTDEVIVPIIEMEGLGHCAFEEDADAFCLKVGELVNAYWD
jgi:pimeloyl-ACP methyl ester carboxylesterase